MVRSKGGRKLEMGVSESQSSIAATGTADNGAPIYAEVHIVIG